MQNEKDSEQGNTCQGGGILEFHERSGNEESWRGMPQMKRLKGLKLPVGNENGTGGCGGPSALQSGASLVMSASF
jgi:hypothetical protein